MRLLFHSSLLLLLFFIVLSNAALKSSEGSEEDDDNNRKESPVDTDRTQGRKSKRPSSSRGSRREGTKEEYERTIRASALPPQEIANCPVSCKCNKTSVSCIDTDISDAKNLFLQVQPLAFPSLDTLVLTGNRLGDLSGSSLFGSHQVHNSLSLMNLTDNRISALSTDTFIGLPKMEYLYLGHNIISSMSHNTFGAMKSLRVLDLGGSLKGKAVKPENLKDALNAIHNLPQLQDLDVSMNTIKELHPSTFCMMPQLNRLILSHNALTSFEVDKNCLAGLRHLDVRGNSFRTISISLWKSVEVTAWDISENPLECHCDLKPFIELAQRQATNFLNQERTLCASPAAFAGKSIFDIKTDDMCIPRGSNFFSNIFLLILFGGVAFVIYRFYRHKIPIPRQFQFAYSSLNERERRERDPEPAFL